VNYTFYWLKLGGGFYQKNERNSHISAQTLKYCSSTQST